MRTPFRRKIRHLVPFVSFALFPLIINWFSPYLSVHGAWSGVVTGSVMVFGALLVTAPFLGRSFCSWACPAGFAQEAVAHTRTTRIGAPKLGRIKWFVWTPWMVALAAGWLSTGIQAVVPDWSPGPVGNRDWLQSIGGGTLMATAVTTLFVALALVFGRRGACHTLCWMAPFVILGRKSGRALRIPGLKLEATASSCVACGRCNAVCPMGLPVQTLARTGQMEHAECILCADCVDTCPKHTIRLGWGR